MLASSPYEHIYDPMLDEYEPGMKTAEVQAIFETLRPQQAALIAEIASRPQVDASFLHQPFDGQKQWDFGVEVITRFGYDWQRGRQDKAVHPFTMGLGIDDVRITCHLRLRRFGLSVPWRAMRSGRGIDRKYSRTARASQVVTRWRCTVAVTQENLVGACTLLGALLSTAPGDFPQQLGSVDLGEILRHQPG
jgi:carboxypeptidase Taq